MNIIAISGSKSIDKTEAINSLYSSMIQFGFNDIGGNFGGSLNFWSVLIKNDKKVGITTFGKTYKSLAPKLDMLNRIGCEIIVCTCLCGGQTNELIENKPGFNHEYIQLVSSNLKGLGTADINALAILTRIEQLI